MDEVIDWGHIVSHETFHLWNGQGMSPETQQDWFKEGFTDYMAIMTMKRLGFVDECLFLKRLEAHAERYLAALDKTSMAEAGKEKKKNWNLIYGGGALAAMVLDIEIRERTNQQKSLEEVLRQMYQRFGNKKYNFNDIVQTANSVAGTDLSDFFARYVQGTETLPIARTLEKAGYRFIRIIQGDVFIVRNSNANESQKRMQTEWLHQR
jgi:predicted metalloprotease with PDZ domain